MGCVAVFIEHSTFLIQHCLFLQHCLFVRSASGDPGAPASCRLAGRHPAAPGSRRLEAAGPAAWKAALRSEACMPVARSGVVWRRIFILLLASVTATYLWDYQREYT